MFIAALFTTAKRWRRPKCPSADEWISKMWSIPAMGYYSALKKKKEWKQPKCPLIDEWIKKTWCGT